MTTTVNLTMPVDALVSYHYFRDDKTMGRVANPGHLRLIGDSGAFSAYSQGATITVPEYADWCTKWADRLSWRASLDVIGDPMGSLKNWQLLRDRYRLDTVPTIHVGTDPTWIGAYASEGVDFIGLGGMVGRPIPTIMRWSAAMLRHARDHYPQVRFHAWGQAGRQYMDALPVYSADSSRSAVAYRFGILRLFDPATGRQINLHLNGGAEVMRHGKLLRDVYGVDPRLVLTSHGGNRRLLIRLAAAVVQRYASWLQERHAVTPPAYGITGTAPGGPVVHTVSVAPEDYEHLNPDLPDMIERTPR